MNCSMLTVAKGWKYEFFLSPKGLGYCVHFHCIPRDVPHPHHGLFLRPETSWNCRLPGSLMKNRGIAGITYGNDSRNWQYCKWRFAYPHHSSNKAHGYLLSMVRKYAWVGYVVCSLGKDPHHELIIFCLWLDLDIEGSNFKICKDSLVFFHICSSWHMT